MPDLWHGDCLEILRYIPDHSVDLVLTDPPYGTTANQWDTPLDLAAIWPQLRRVGRPTTPVLLFAQLPFLIDVAISNRAELKYSWICEKGNATGFFNANRAPMKAYEQVLVFYRAGPKYNPQMEKGDPYIRHRKGEKSSNYRGPFDDTSTVSNGRRYPRDIIGKDKWTWGGGHYRTSHAKAGASAGVSDPHLYGPGRHGAGLHHGLGQYGGGLCADGAEFYRDRAGCGLFCHGPEADRGGCGDQGAGGRTDHNRRDVNE